MKIVKIVLSKILENFMREKSAKSLNTTTTKEKKGELKSTSMQHSDSLITSNNSMQKGLPLKK